MLKDFIYKFTESFRIVGSTLAAAALVAIIFDEVNQSQAYKLLAIGIIFIVITSLSLIILKEKKQ
jgi:hypothetical protein